MKKLLLLFIFQLTVSLTYAQNFEGKITYQNNFKSNLPQITDAQWASMMGNEQQYFYKNGNYKSVTNGQLSQWQLYINKDNKLYTKISTTETILWNDGNTPGDKVLDITVNKNATEILGHKCDEIVLKGENGVQKFYFNSKFAIDPNQFTQHTFGNWYDFVSKAKALPLKMIIENKQFTLTSIATAIQPSKLDSSIFILPEGSKTEKNPY